MSLLVDYVSTEKLPHLIVWLDWNLYAYWGDFLACLLIMNLHYIYDTLRFPGGRLTIGGLITASFVGFCLWCFCQAVDQGYGIG